ncbi:tectonic-3-like [Periplaneta americana]|uniref:tectonic-3-like n=1 Tax=Periplaneta americana TaxID=6978 RepID=UPI0037E90B33
MESLGKAYFQNAVFLCFMFTTCYSDVRYINWSLATEKGFSHKEREYGHPAYNDVAIVSCDLTENSCDINCCSDQDCSLEQKDAFKCIEDFQDHQERGSLREKSCAYVSEHEQIGWQSFLCYVAKNTPYLGEYFVTQKKIENLALFGDLMTHKTGIFNFQKKTESKEKDVDSLVYYKFGSPIKLLTMNVDGTLISGPRYLEMPSNMFYTNGGRCIDSSPVRYLVNRQSNCMQTITRKNCEDGINSQLSAYQYMISDSIGNHSLFPHVAMDGRGRNSTQTEIQFLCFNNGSNYITFSKNIFNPNMSVMLDPVLQDEQTVSLECSGSVEEVMTTSYDVEKEICQNVLISVSYDFVWKGTEIQTLLVTYIIADVPVTPVAFLALKTKIPKSDQRVDLLKMFTKPEDLTRVQLHVSQKFVAKFRHISADQSWDDNATVAEEELQLFSGNPGYDIGGPVIALSKNESSFSYEDGLLAVWGNDQLCLP